MRDWRVTIGVVLGLATAATVICVIDSARRPPAPFSQQGPVLSDCDGTIRELVIQYVPEAAPIVGTAYRDFLCCLPSDIVVHVVCPDQSAFDDLRNRLPTVSCRMVPVVTGHPITCWSRDRWLALAPGTGDGGPLLLAPSDETGAHAWPARRGDHRVAGALATAMPDALAARRSHLSFDGGDFVCDSHTVFVTPHVSQRSVGGATASVSTLRQDLHTALKREITLLEDAPPHHAGMFMMPAGGRRMLVGDPSVARDLLAGVDRAALDIPDPDFSAAAQKRFDAVSATCGAAGYEVTRMPVVPGIDGRSYWTYLNVIIDERAGRRVVYMPVYRTADRLNDAAATVWRDLGYEVRPVDCSATFRHGGSLRCLVNILSRA